ncbi:putative secreted hydrolase [Polymorphobacter fuscus]|nr:carotenoid 1,2-hydratase [Polymorphobacter fuscus]NJC08487.1 putative secreted hydrolase [Polymorphobacter fuscus]
MFLALFAMLLGAAAPTYTPVTPATPISFPRDHGAHPDFRTEWWYVTGWLKTDAGENLGFQVTFFRSKLATDPANPSRFAPRQILFAHAALSDPKAGKLRHAQRIARAGFGLAQASTTDTDLVLDDWTLRRRADGNFTTHVAGDGFALDLVFTPGQAAILQGDAGYSQKGPDPREASHYYSLPHLGVGGTLTRDGTPATVTGTAWLDREWSSTLLNPRAVGWDWLGLNMDDGGALTLFRVRDKAGADVWAGGSYRDKAGRQTKLRPADVRFRPGRRWRSPRTGALYPVAPQVVVRLNGSDRVLAITPLFDDQELDSRRGGGPVYWEGAVTVPGGRGYLEMTGYAAPLKM